MKKLFLIITTSNDQWEMSEGVNIVSADTEEIALSLLKESDELGSKETIVSIQELKSESDSVIYRLGPTVE